MVFIGLLVLCHATTVLGQSPKIDEPRKQLSSILTAEQVIEDVDYFLKVLKAGHPDLYRYISQAQLDSMATQVKAKAGKLTYSELYNELTIMGVAVGCGHLYLTYPKAIERYLYLHSYYPPLYIEMHGRDAKVVGDYEDLIGPELTFVRAIDGVPMDTIIAEVNKYIYRDGYINTGVSWALQQGFFADYYNRHLADKESYTYLLEQQVDSGWVQKEVTLPAWDYKNPTYLYSNYVWREKQLDFTIDEETNTAILKIKSFDFYTIKRGKQRFYKFLKTVHRDIIEKQPEQLVIDVRDNEGGSPFLAALVVKLFSTESISLDSVRQIRYRSENDTSKLFKVDYKRSYRRIEKSCEPIENGNLAKEVTPDKINWLDTTYKGNLYVMVNGGTFSAASELACYLKANQGATIVGIESGGSCDPISAGFTGDAELPNSKMILTVPLVTYYNRVPLPSEPGRGILPDIPIRTIGNNPNVDEQLEYLLEEIKQRQENLSVN